MCTKFKKINMGVMATDFDLEDWIQLMKTGSTDGLLRAW
jgi:hypothetical protein